MLRSWRTSYGTWSNTFSLLTFLTMSRFPLEACILRVILNFGGELEYKMMQTWGRPKIEEWSTMKREMKAQFLPCNAAWVVRESLKKLQHTSTVREYVKEFSSLMLDISNMSKEDKLFNFLFGLQTWAQTKLQRQGVRDLQGAMAAADSLVDLNLGHHPSTNKSKDVTSKNWKKFEGKDKDVGKILQNQSQNKNE
ncbi:hypothetical protein ACLB2K_051150 [Fragaria x ananassa]